MNKREFGQRNRKKFSVKELLQAQKSTKNIAQSRNCEKHFYLSRRVE